MILETLVVGCLQANCYLVGCRQKKDALVIDPGDDADAVISLVERLDLTVKAIVLTHGHWDHAGAVGTLQERIAAPLLCHQDEEMLLADPRSNLAVFLDRTCDHPLCPDRLLRHGDTVRAGRFTFRILHTPGHTPGGICLHGNGVVFTGDTLFAGAVGRTDLPGGDYVKLIRSIHEQLLPLDDETKVYPGHGPATTIGTERRENPYLSMG